MPRPTLYDDTLRQDLIAAAADAIAEGGTDALSLRSVAGRVGTSTNAVYTLFGNKDALVAAVVGEAVASFTAAQSAQPPTENPLADLYALGLAYRSWALTNPALYAVMFGGRVRFTEPAAPDAADPGMAPLLAAITRLLDGRVLGGATAAQIAESIWAMVHGWVSLEISAWSGCPVEANQAGYERHLDAIARAWLSGPRRSGRRRTSTDSDQ